MKRVLVVLALLSAVVLPGANTAVAANENASCMGLGISDHAKAGDLLDEIAAVKEFLAANDLNLGAFASRFAKVHAGSHVPGCEEAAGAILEELAGG